MGCMISKCAARSVKGIKECMGGENGGGIGRDLGAIFMWLLNSLVRKAWPFPVYEWINLY